MKEVELIKVNSYTYKKNHKLSTVLTTVFNGGNSIKVPKIQKYLTYKEASSALCSAAKHAGSSKARRKW